MIPCLHIAVVQKSWVTEFCMAAPNICGSSVWTLLHATLLAHGI